MKKKSMLMLLLTFIGICFVMTMSKPANTHAATKRAYDLSEWQGRLSARKVKQLKGEVPFVILRVQYGSSYNDRTFNHNRNLLNKYQVPYGVYSFSLYNNSASAANEARLLYQRAPEAKFYVNDFETTSISSKRANAATRKWARTIKPMVGGRKVLFYSYQSFMQTYASRALNAYDGYWVAAYTRAEPTMPHVMWQYTDRHYSKALRKRLDASKLRQDQQWFIGGTAAQPQPAKPAPAPAPAKVVHHKKKHAKKVVKKVHHKKRVKKHPKKHVKKRHVKKIRHKKRHVKKHKKRHVKKHAKKHTKKRRHVKKAHHKKKHHKKRHARK